MLAIIIYLTPGALIVGGLVYFKYYPIRRRRYTVDKGNLEPHDTKHGYNPHHIDNMGV